MQTQGSDVQLGFWTPEQKPHLEGLAQGGILLDARLRRLLQLCALPLGLPGRDLQLGLRLEHKMKGRFSIRSRSPWSVAEWGAHGMKFKLDMSTRWQRGTA